MSSKTNCRVGTSNSGRGPLVAVDFKPGTIVQYEDLRDFLVHVDGFGELGRADGVDMHLEVGALSAVARESELTTAVLCDNIPGLEPGMRLLLNPLHSFNRAALALGLPVGLPRAEYDRLGPEKWRNLKLIPPRVVTDGPVLENVLEGDDVDLTRFPRPFWCADDGGAYMGTGVSVITRDPETGWVNAGAYRVMYHDPTHVSVYINPDNHGQLHQSKYFREHRPCPVLITLGSDPVLFAMSAQRLPRESCEYDYMGGLRGEPAGVIEEAHTGLPMLARAELVLAGEIHPDDVAPEGPFGEWTGYYGSGVQDLPRILVRAVYHRSDPIMLGDPPGRPPRQPSVNTYLEILRGGIHLERMRSIVPGVRDVYSFPAGAGSIWVVSIQQQYPGHAKQAGLALFNLSTLIRYAVVVDEDVNIRDLEEVVWAICTRSDPVKDLDIITRCRTTPLDPIIPPWEHNLKSQAVVDATRPFEWRDRFPKTVEVSPELRQQVRARWAHVIA